jgi:hypothetical protein
VKRNIARRANLPQGDGQWLVATIFVRLWLEADGKALAKALSKGIIEEVDHGEEEKS